ncbi:MAG TPA: helix-turn-helix domain-containing protein [Gemmataceae bacterium]|nr:helix-turn-helix domain-containing protein [Gemmataceae bacterium]
MPDTLPCFTICELARRWRCRPATVRAMVRRGVLQAIQLGGRVRILPEEIRNAEQKTLAVKPAKRRPRQEKVDPEIARMLE